jgi:hypothetical protein
MAGPDRKTGGTLWGKTFITFGCEGGMGDAVMTAVFQEQNKYLQEATQRIVQNLAYTDEIIEINKNDEEDEELEGTGITLSQIFLQYLDKKVNLYYNPLNKQSLVEHIALFLTKVQWSK